MMSKTRKKEPQMAQGETDHCGHFIEEETEAQRSIKGHEARMKPELQVNPFPLCPRPKPPVVVAQTLSQGCRF